MKNSIIIIVGIVLIAAIAYFFFIKKPSNASTDTNNTQLDENGNPMGQNMGKKPPIEL